MNNSIQVFNYNGAELRTVDINGEPWFVAKDACDILSIKNVSDALTRLDDDEKMTLDFSEGHSGQRGGAQFMNIISESGLYALILRSNKPEAKDFSRWVRKDVLPSIRKHGVYLTPQAQEELITNPDFIIRIAQELKAERIKVKALQAQAEQDRPKVIFAESVEASKDCILVRDLAKLLRQNGVMVGQNRLFEELRNRGFLIKSGSDYNMPTQKSMELGLMVILERTINRGDGELRSTRTPKITGKGQVYFINLFLKEVSMGRCNPVECN